VSERLAKALKAIPRHITSPYVFRTKKGRSLRVMRTAFDNACPKAKIVGFRFHDLRHTTASHMVMAGMSLAAVGVILVHKTSAMTSRYAHLSQDLLRDAVNALPDFTGHKTGTSEGGAADE
jgi:integrase